MSLKWQKSVTKGCAG